MIMAWIKLDKAYYTLEYDTTFLGRYYYVTVELDGNFGKSDVPAESIMFDDPIEAGRYLAYHGLEGVHVQKIIYGP